MVRRLAVPVLLVGFTGPFHAVPQAWAGDICRFPPRVVVQPGEVNADPVLAPVDLPASQPLRPIAQCYEVSLEEGASFPEDLVLHDGYLYVTGGTGRDEPADDVFVAKLRASDGSEQWRQVIDIGGGDDGYAVRVGADGALYVAGVANDYQDGFLASLDPATGAVQWMTLIGTTSEDQVSDLAAIDGGVYVVGSTKGDFDPDDGVGPAGKYDLFVALYDSEGNRVWGEQRGTTGKDIAGDVTTDEEGNVYIAGYTAGSLYGSFAGTYDLFVARYAPDGTLDWGLQEGTSGSDFAYGIHFAPDGYLYVTGGTNGDLFGTGSGDYDYFLARYDQDGTPDDELAFQDGTSASDYASYVRASDSGRLYVAGMTSGDLFGAARGETDVFLAEYDPSGGTDISWSKQVGGAGTDYVTGLTVNEEGSRVWVSGLTNDAGSGYLAMFAIP